MQPMAGRKVVEQQAERFKALETALTAAEKDLEALAGNPDQRQAAVETIKNADKAKDDAHRAVIVDGKMAKLVALGGQADPFLGGDQTPYANRQPPPAPEKLRELDGNLDLAIAKLGTDMESAVKAEQALRSAQWASSSWPSYGYDDWFSLDLTR